MLEAQQLQLRSLPAGRQAAQWASCHGQGCGWPVAEPRTMEALSGPRMSVPSPCTDLLACSGSRIPRQDRWGAVTQRGPPGRGSHWAPGGRDSWGLLLGNQSQHSPQNSPSPSFSPSFSSSSSSRCPLLLPPAH